MAGIVNCKTCGKKVSKTVPACSHYGVLILERYVKLIYFLVILFIIPGCATYHTTRFSADDIIWKPQTEFGREIHKKLFNEFQEIINEVQASPNLTSIEFVKDGIGVIYRKEEEGVYYIQFHFFHNIVYNTLQTTYQKRASSTYARNLFALSKLINDKPELFEDNKIFGFNILFEWKATNFIEDKYKLYAQQEGINAFIPKQVLRDFANLKISIQELGKKTIFFSSLGRTELDFSDSI